MPKLYKYLGIIVFFYSNEHEPIHVHGRYGNCESKKPLSPSQSKDFKKLVSVLADEIIQSWINYFVYHKKIIAKNIEGKL